MSEPAIPAPGKCGIPGTRAWLASFFACGIVVLTAVVLWGDNVAANGKFVYGLDDAYIHLTISRTFSEHGVWGVCPQEWVSASSSPLWTLLLALWHRVSGTAEQAPLLLNMAVAILLILACDDFLRRFWPRYFRIPGMRAGFLSALVFVVPVPALLISGMEHLLHILLAVLYLGCAVGHLWPEDGGQPRGTGALIAVTMLGVAIRYETLFLVVPVVAVLAWRRQWRMAYALLVASLVPVVVFGVYFQWNGATFIPVSVLIKTFRADLAVRPNFQGIPGGRIVSQFLSCPSLFALTIAGVFVAFCARRSPEAVFRRLAGTSGLVAASSLLHVQFADTGWFFRYEAYLLTIGMLAIVPAVYECGSFLASIGGGRKYMIWYMTCAAGILVFCGIGSRAVRAAWETPLAYRNIGGQQYQIARFLADPSEDQRPVALNDVGAVGYYTAVRMIDLTALTSPGVLRAGLSGRFDTGVIDRLTRESGAGMAILYADWFKEVGGVPASWTALATWRIADNVVCGRDTVTFYAVDVACRENLLARLKRYEPSLPPWVRVSYLPGTN